MNIDWITFHRAFQGTDDRTRALLTSTKIYDSVVAALSQQGKAIKYSDVMAEIGYHLLKLRTMEETLSQLEALGVPDVYSFLKKITQELAKATLTPPPSLSGLEEEIAEAEELFKSTPVSFAKQNPHPTPQVPEPTYQSSQAEILKTPVSTPSPTPPRWETDTPT